MLLDPRTQLHYSHDVSETLQYCAEGLDEVDRAFVTTDCRFFSPSHEFVIWGIVLLTGCP